MYNCKKITERRLRCDKLEGDNFGFPWAVVIPAALTAVAAIGSGIFGYKTAKQQKQAVQAQYPIAELQLTTELQKQTMQLQQTRYALKAQEEELAAQLQQTQYALELQQKEAKAKERQILMYGVIGLAALLLID